MNSLLKLAAVLAASAAVSAFIVGCENANTPVQSASPSPSDQTNTTNTELASKKVGEIKRLSPKLDAIIPADASIEALASGFTWPEGPLWSDDENALYFNDVPENKLYKWTRADGLSVFLAPSGGGGAEAAATMREPGANGLIHAPERPGYLLLADHGSRGLSMLNLETKEREVLVSSYDGKSLNSPNDMIARSDGAIFFTDPPYGLRGLNDAAEKELSHNGVYLFQDSKPLKLLVDDLSFPNGIVLSPDEQTLFVSVSDPDNPVIMAYDIPDGSDLSSGRVFFDAKPLLKDGGGLPDGMVMSKNGTLFATGPDGVYVFDIADGSVLGIIATDMPISNATLNADETFLYMTSSSILARIPVALE